MEFNKKMHALVDHNFDEMVAMVQKYVRMDTILEEDKVTTNDPFGTKLTKALVAFLEDAQKLGFSIKNIDNHAGHADFGESNGKLIGVLAHLDVVPIGNEDAWTYPPFSAEIADGKIFGRGAVDDKGPAISSLYAMKALKECGAKLNNKFRIIVGLDEESGSSKCIIRYLEKEKTPDYSFSPDANFPVINAEKGIFRFDVSSKLYPPQSDIRFESMTAGDRYNVVPDEAVAVFTGNLKRAKQILDNTTVGTVKIVGDEVIYTVRGKTAHAMEPTKGVNALLIMLHEIMSVDHLALGVCGNLAKIQRLLLKETDGKSLGIAREDDISGKLTCNIANIRAINDFYTIKADVRYPVTINYEDMVTDLKRTISTIDAELKLVLNKIPLYLSEELEFIQILLATYNDYMKEDAKPIAIGGGTYCRFLDNAVSFGPVFPNESEMAHQPDEFISLDSLRKATHIYAEALYRLNKI